jgi:hypothetical protein
MEDARVRSSRRSFLRSLGLALGAGIGVLAVPGAAKANVGQCCLDNTNCSGTCPSGQYLYFCDCGGAGGNYCTCHDWVGFCYGPPIPC